MEGIYLVLAFAFPVYFVNANILGGLGNLGGGGFPPIGGGGADIGSLLGGAGGGGGQAASLIQGSQFLAGNQQLMGAADPKGAANAVVSQLGVGPKINNKKCNEKLKVTVKKFKKMTEQMDQLKDALGMLDQLEQLNALFPANKQSNPLQGSQKKLLADLEKFQKLEMLDELIECEKHSRKGYPLDKVADVKNLVPGKMNFNNPSEFKTFLKGAGNYPNKFKKEFSPEKVEALMDVRKACIENLEVESEKCKALQKQACQLMDMMEGKGMADFAFDDINPTDIKGLQSKLNKFQEPLNEIKNIDAKVKNCDNLAKLTKGKGNPKKMMEKTLQDALTSGAIGAIGKK